jgi:hypothetical protein
LAGNGHVDQGRCPDIDAFLMVNLPSGCSPTKVNRKSTGSENLRNGKQLLRLMRNDTSFCHEGTLKWGIIHHERVSDKTLKAGSWIGLRTLRRNHKPGAERFQGVDGRWWLRHQVIGKIPFRQGTFVSGQLVHLSSDDD